MDAGRHLAWSQGEHRHVDLEPITVLSGQLAFRDPFEQRADSTILSIPTGRHKVWVTEVGDEDGVNVSAYLTVRFSGAEPDWVSVADELAAQEVPTYGLWTGTDHGLIALFDADALAPDEIPVLAGQWCRSLNDEANPYRFNYANIPLPGDPQTNIILSRSGHGDGAIAIMASYDIDGKPVAVHLDFGIVDSGQAPSSQPRQGPLATAGRLLRRITMRRKPSPAPTPTVDVHHRDRADRTPLHYAVLDGPEGSANDWKETDLSRREELRTRSAAYKYTNVQRLVAHGADVNAREADNWTPLHFASRDDSPEVVRLLLDSGADPNAINGRGQTPITIAAGNTTSKGAEIVQLLRDFGADPFLASGNGVSGSVFGIGPAPRPMSPT